MNRMRTLLGSLMLVLGFACVSQAADYSLSDFKLMNKPGEGDGTIPTSS